MPTSTTGSTSVLQAEGRPGALDDNVGTMRSHFFVSYTEIDREWAIWIAWCLEEAGYRVIIQDWDFRAGNNFVLLMDEALKACDRVVAVLSPNFMASRFAAAEWAAAFKRDPRGEKGILVPVRVVECEPVGLLGQVIHVNLVGLAAESARETLLRKLQAGRAKPKRKPPFPGARPGDGNRPQFPGPSATEAAASPRARRLKSYALFGSLVFGFMAGAWWIGTQYGRTARAPDMPAVTLDPSSDPVPTPSPTRTGLTREKEVAVAHPAAVSVPASKARLTPSRTLATEQRRAPSSKRDCRQDQVGRPSGVEPFPPTFILDPCVLDDPARKILEKEVIPLSRRTRECEEQRPSNAVHISILIDKGVVRRAYEDTMFARGIDEPESCIDRIWSELVGLQIPSARRTLSLNILVGDP